MRNMKWGKKDRLTYLGLDSLKVNNKLSRGGGSVRGKSCSQDILSDLKDEIEREDRLQLIEVNGLKYEKEGTLGESDTEPIHMR
jgi:hypothetical protein